MSFTRKPIETEIRSNPHSYLESSAKMHAVRVLATPSSRICSEPAWGMGTERQRPRPGATNAWKMDQPREGVCEVSPGPIYCPAKYADKYRPPIWSAQARTPYYLMGGRGYLGRLKEHDYLKTEIEFVDGGAVFPGAPRPPGNNYSVNGVPYTVGAINAVGRGSNKARTDAISKWLGLVPGEAANASAKLLPSGPSGPVYEVSGINAIGQGSNAGRTDAIDRFLDKAMLRGDEGWSDQPFSKEHRTKKRGDAH